ncbi:MAG: DUF302 domain-containing protein [Cytophagales bacterium]|nr:DUF302 domain-containing protein [Cytophagales bacterium]
MSRASFVILFLVVGGTVFGQTLSVYKSEISVEETTEILIEVIRENELIFFETVAHDKIALERGVEMDLTREVLFEDADLTTSLIQCQPTTALDLPLKVLVWEENEDVYIGFIDPKFMKKRFMLTNCEETVDEMGKLLIKVVVDTLKATRARG